jgi:protein-histidine pros-kinase
LSGESLYFASPIKITNPACLNCHSTVDAAPESMIKLYGTANGFGWKLNEVVGAQIVTVPMEIPIKNANEAFVIFMSVLAAVFVFIIIILNVLLHFLVVKPIIKMADVADRMSKGEEDLPEFNDKGKNEIAILGASFNRMKRSLEKAMSMLGA